MTIASLTAAAAAGESSTATVPPGPLAWKAQAWHDRCVDRSQQTLGDASEHHAVQSGSGVGSEHDGIAAVVSNQLLDDTDALTVQHDGVRFHAGGVALRLSVAAERLGVFVEHRQERSEIEPSHFGRGHAENRRVDDAAEGDAAAARRQFQRQSDTAFGGRGPVNGDDDVLKD